MTIAVKDALIAPNEGKFFRDGKKVDIIHKDMVFGDVGILILSNEIDPVLRREDLPEEIDRDELFTDRIIDENILSRGIVVDGADLSDAVIGIKERRVGDGDANGGDLVVMNLRKDLDGRDIMDIDKFDIAGARVVESKLNDGRVIKLVGRKDANGLDSKSLGRIDDRKRDHGLFREIGRKKDLREEAGTDEVIDDEGMIGIQGGLMEVHVGSSELGDPSTKIVIIEVPVRDEIRVLVGDDRAIDREVGTDGRTDQALLRRGVIGEEIGGTVIEGIDIGNGTGIGADGDTSRFIKTRTSRFKLEGNGREDLRNGSRRLVPSDDGANGLEFKKVAGRIIRGKELRVLIRGIDDGIGGVRLREGIAVRNLAKIVSNA